jgi:hypothetical protein
MPKAQGISLWGQASLQRWCVSHFWHTSHPLHGRICFVNECCQKAGLQRAPGEVKSVFEETRREYVDYFVFQLQLSIKISNFLAFQMFPLDIRLP